MHSNSGRHGMDEVPRPSIAPLLLRPQKKSFAEVLAAMPNVGRDEDFERDC